MFLKCFPLNLHSLQQMMSPKVKVLLLLLFVRSKASVYQTQYYRIHIKKLIQRVGMDHWFYCLHSSWHSVKHSEETWRVVPCIHGYGQEMAERLEGLGAGTEEPSWQGSWQFRILIEVLLHMGRNVLDGQHGLLACGLDLRLGQQEAILTLVTQLEGVGIFHSQVVGPVIRASSSGV